MVPWERQEIEQRVVDAELVDEPPARRIIPATVVRVVRHEATKTTGRAVIRHAIYPVAGALVVARKVWEAHTNTIPQQMIRAARARGDLDAVAAWYAAGEQAKERRHKRAMDWLTAPWQITKALLLACIGVIAASLVLGLVLAIASKDKNRVLEPIGALLDLVEWTAYAVTIAWGPLVLAAPWVVVLWLWHEGRRSGTVPAWAQTADTDNGAVVVDERAIAHALSHLGIGPLARYFKDGGVLSYTKIPARDGLGVAAGVRLPPGVTASDVIRAKTRLAANLGRAGVETWPSTGVDEGLLDLWIADRGALDTGAGPWPLLEGDDPIDVYRGVPVGITLRGDEVLAPIDGTSWLIGGRPGQGKTTYARLLIMGACLDPTAEIWVHVLADNPDFDPLAARFSRYQVGVGHDVAAAALQAFHDLMAEIAHRGKVMRAKGAPTAAEAGFPPLLAAFDEVHRLFQHREYGDEAARIAEDVIKQARKYGVIVILITQSPTATSIPKPVTRETICRVAFSVVDQIANDALLGDGKHRQGVRATELRPGSKASPGDRGKALTVGVVPETDWSVLIGHNVELPGVRLIADRAARLLARHGRTVTPMEQTAEPRDLLSDVAEVLGADERAEVAQLARRLVDLDPVWRGMTGVQLAVELRSLGVRVSTAKNRPSVTALDVAETAHRRDREAER